MRFKNDAQRRAVFANLGKSGVYCSIFRFSNDRTKDVLYDIAGDPMYPQELRDLCDNVLLGKSNISDVFRMLMDLYENPDSPKYLKNECISNAAAFMVGFDLFNIFGDSNDDIDDYLKFDIEEPLKEHEEVLKKDVFDIEEDEANELLSKARYGLSDDIIEEHKRRMILESSTSSDYEFDRLNADEIRKREEDKKDAKELLSDAARGDFDVDAIKRHESRMHARYAGLNHDIPRDDLDFDRYYRDEVENVKEEKPEDFDALYWLRKKGEK